MSRRVRGSGEGPRLATPAESDQLGELMSRSFGFHQHREARPQRRRPRHRHGVRGSWVLERDGKLVSHIKLVYNHLSIFGCRLKISSIGGVGTDPDYRGQGLATTLLEHCLNEATRAGAALMLISGQRGLYRRASAVNAGGTFEVTVEPGSIRAEGEHSVRPVQSEDWLACARLYQAEPVRFIRSADFFRRSLTTGWHREAWVVESRGGMVAYIRLGRGWGREHDRPWRNVVEYAGARAALVGALPSMLKAGGIGQLDFCFPRHDQELAYIFASEGLERKATTIADHTIRLLHLPTLMRSLRPYLRARLAPAEARQLAFGQEEETCVFGYGDDRISLDLGQSARLCLGGRGAVSVSGELGRVLASLFPVPLPLPGMNYV